MSRAFSLFSALALVVGMGAVFAPASSAAVATNSLIKGSDAAVYYLGNDSKRYVFPNEHIFKSWYQDFSGVKTVSASELATYPIGGNVKYRAGTRLVKIVSDPKVYAISSDGSLHALSSESAAANLYGPAWANRVDDLSDAFFFDYQIGSELDGSQHPQGTVFRYSGQTSYYLLLADSAGTLQARPLSTSLISAWRINTADALTLNASLFAYPTGASLTSTDVALSYPNARTTTTTPPSTPTPPAATPATLTVSAGTGLSTSMIAVRNDDQALIYRLQVKGDTTHAVTINTLAATVYIDAGGADTDFTAGTDEDGIVIWPVNQVANEWRLQDNDTGDMLDMVPTVDGSGRLVFDAPLTVAAKQTRNFNITAHITNAPNKTRLAVDVKPSADLTVTSPTASTITLSPTSSLNGGATPGIAVALKTFGKLLVTSTSATGDSFRPLGQSYTAYTLTFTSTGEAFTVNSLELKTTSEGSSYLAVTDAFANYTNKAGEEKTDDVTEIDNGRFRFTNLGIYVPKDGKISVPFSFSISDQAQVYSNSRLQMDFSIDRFSARSSFSDLQYVDGDFANNQKLVDSTTAGSLAIFRLGSLTIGTNPAAPKTSVTRYSKTTVMTFNITGQDQETRITRLMFKLETNDLNEDGDDNDLLERYADQNPFNLIGLYGHNAPSKEERSRFVPFTTSFAIYDKSANNLDTTPAGLQTGVGDYGLFTLDFSSSPIVISPGQTLMLDVDIDTTFVSSDLDNWVRLRLLGDLKSAVPANANFLWDDGSHISGSGYLITGLDQLGSTLSIN